MINGVLAPYFLQRLVSDIAEQKYSLLLDVEFHWCIWKYLGIVFRYYCLWEHKSGQPHPRFGWADGWSRSRAISTALMEFLVKSGLKKEHLISIGTDNPPVMTDTNNGVYKILRDENGLSNFVPITCVFHSSGCQPCLTWHHTMKCGVPWFSVSSKRRNAYRAGLWDNQHWGKSPCRSLNCVRHGGCPLSLQLTTSWTSGMSWSCILASQSLPSIAT